MLWGDAAFSTFAACTEMPEVCKTRAPPPEIFPPTVANSALRLMPFHHCILNSRTVFVIMLSACVDTTLFLVVLYIACKKSSLVFIIISKNKDSYIKKTVKVLVFGLFCVFVL